MTERTKTIKGLISGQVDMGTFGLVELELLAIEKENETLKLALEKIANPIKYLREDAEKEGTILDDRMVFYINNDANLYKNIISRILEEIKL